MSIRCANLLLDLVLAFSVFAPSASSQGFQVVKGATVRLYTGDTSPVEGVVSEVDADHISVLLSPREGYARVPAKDVQRVEVGHGTRTGAALGLLAGGGIGTAVGFAIAGPTRGSSGCWLFCSDEQRANDREISQNISTVIVSGIAGAAIGGIVGNVIYNRKWVQVWRDRSSPSVTIRPWLERGAGVRVSLPLSFDR
jgi:hypothetical protein